MTTDHLCCTRVLWSKPLIREKKGVFVMRAKLTKNQLGRHAKNAGLCWAGDASLQEDPVRPKRALNEQSTLRRDGERGKSGVDGVRGLALVNNDGDAVVGKLRHGALRRT